MSFYIIEKSQQNRHHVLFLDFYLPFLVFWDFYDTSPTQKKTELSSCRRRADIVALWWIGGLLGGLEGGPLQGEL